MQAILEPLNQELMLAESGTDALRLCLDHDFAAILLDVRMPEMDGFETAELIRARKPSRQTPILFLTAYRSDEQLFRGYDLGAVDFLFKPIVPEMLQSKVEVFVELRRSEQLLRRQAEELARTERKFRAVLEAAPDAMVITSEDGTIELANSRVDMLFQYSREALIGQNIRMLIPEWECSTAERFRESWPRRRSARWVSAGMGPPFPRRSPAVRFKPRKPSSSPPPFATSPTRWSGGPNPADQSGTGAKGRGAHRRAQLLERGFAAIRLGRQPRSSGAHPHRAHVLSMALGGGQRPPGGAGIGHARDHRKPRIQAEPIARRAAAIHPSQRIGPAGMDAGGLQ